MARTTEQTILWLKAAQKRQQEWQQEVKNRNPLLTAVTADFDQTAISLTNKPGE